MPIVIFLHGRSPFPRIRSRIRLIPLEGGPGGGFTPRDRTFFDPEKYKVRP